MDLLVAQGRAGDRDSGLAADHRAVAVAAQRLVDADLELELLAGGDRDLELVRLVAVGADVDAMLARREPQLRDAAIVRLDRGHLGIARVRGIARVCDQARARDRVTAPADTHANLELPMRLEAGRGLDRGSVGVARRPEHQAAEQERHAEHGGSLTSLDQRAATEMVSVAERAPPRGSSIPRMRLSGSPRPSRNAWIDSTRRRASERW